MAEIDELRSQVARAAQILGRLNLTREPAGHVSARVPGSDLILIKARGPGESPLSYVGPEGVITVDMSGKKVEGADDLASPNEVFIHTSLYRRRPELGSVLHIHPPTVVAFTIAGRPLLPVIGAYSPAALQILLDGLPTYPRSVLINSAERGEELAKMMGEARACLMRGHGITAVGRNVEESTLTAINLNELAEINFKASLLGTPQPIPDEDLEEFKAMRLRARQRAADEEPPRSSSAWRYYDRLVGD